MPFLPDNLGDFFLAPPRNPDAIALWDPLTRECVCYGKLMNEVWRWAAFFAADPRSPAVMLLSNSVQAVQLLLGLWKANVPVMLLDSSGTPEYAIRVAREFHAGWIIAPNPLQRLSDHATEYRVVRSIAPNIMIWRRRKAPAIPIDSNLALMLPTSGSTGSSRMVRLSKHGLMSNILDIIKVLRIVPDDRAVASLPLSYSYGLSVLTTHLRAGASIVLTRRSVIDPAFWELVNTSKVTTFAGVPYTYQMLRTLAFDAPTLSVGTQAGGALELDCIQHFWHHFRAREGRFYVMYGQTEAGPRITTLDSENLKSKLGSVGKPMPSGRIWVDPLDDTEDGAGEIIYAGPNVMLGYAEHAEDLCRGDDMHGTLRTGDLGYIDHEGYLYLTGRLKRIAKILGRRISLDDLERRIGRGGLSVAVIQHKETIVVFTSNSDATDASIFSNRLAVELGIPSGAIVVKRVNAIPTLPNSKIDYVTLGSIASLAHPVTGS